MTKRPSWRTRRRRRRLPVRRPVAVCPISSRRRPATACRAGCPTARSRWAGSAGRLLSVARGRRRAGLRERLETMVGDVRGALRAARDRLSRLAFRATRVALTLTDPAQRDQALAEIDKLNPTSRRRRRADSAISTRDDAGRAHRAAPDRCQARPSCGQAAISQSLEVVRRRIDELGTREASIQRQGADRILVQVPGEKDPENIKRLLGETARLTFHMVDLEGSVAGRAQGRVPPGDMLLRIGRARGHRARALSGQAPGRAQRREPDRRPAILPGQPAGRELPLRQCRVLASSARSRRRMSASRSRSCSTTR